MPEVMAAIVQGAPLGAVVVVAGAEDVVVAGTLDDVEVGGELVVERLSEGFVGDVVQAARANAALAHRLMAPMACGRIVIRLTRPPPFPARRRPTLGHRFGKSGHGGRAYCRAQTYADDPRK
jgi:hypothetical protein